MTITEGIEGRPAELIDRLAELVGCPQFDREMAAELPFPIAMALGGRLASVQIDTGREFPEGSVGAETKDEYRWLDRPGYLDELKNRLAELVRTGVDEAFLVRAVRDWIRRWLEGFTDSEEANRRRAEMREFMQTQMSSPDKIARFRERLAEVQPPGSKLPSDDEIAEGAHRLAETLAPITPEQTAKRVAMLDAWDSAVAETLPEPVFEEWLSRYASNVMPNRKERP